MKKPKSLLNYLLVVMFSFVLIACDDNDNNNNNSDAMLSIAEIVTLNENFSTLALALQTAGLDAALEEGTYTVFAPTNEAFAKLGDDTINALLADPDALAEILLYHVIADAEVDSEAAIASAGSTVPMANGDSVALSLDGDNLLVNVSTVIDVDIMATNGIVHVIDTVLIPPAKEGTPSDNIVETAIAAGSFNTLYAALQATGLDALLADENKTFTVFAPTDAAFNALPPGTVDALLMDLPALTAILATHVIEDAAVNSITAFSLNGSEVTTASGDNVTLSIVDGVLNVNNAKVVTYDIYTTNGIIHVIDAVIN